MMNLLTKDGILKIDDYYIETVEVPEWQGSVRIREMSGRDRDTFELAVVKQTKEGRLEMKGLKALMLSLCLVDGNDKRLFSSAEDVEALNGKNGRVIDRLFAIAQRISATGKIGAEQAEKNSLPAPKEEHGSDSQDN